jgi:hypothetical protein
MAFDHLWDDTTPPDTQEANLLGQDLRYLKDDIAQRMGALSGLDAAKPSFENAFAGYLFFAIDTGKIYQLQASDSTPTHIGTWLDVTIKILLTVFPDLMDVIANRPVAGIFNGQPFFATDTSKIYRWDVPTALWQDVTASFIPLTVLKQGTGAGNYTTGSLSFVAVDATNLAYTVNLPIGSSLTVRASGTFIPENDASVGLAVDGTVVVQVEAVDDVITPFSFDWLLAGDGNSHTVDLRYKGTSSGDTCHVLNSSGNIPVMIITVQP